MLTGCRGDDILQQGQWGWSKLKGDVEWAKYRIGEENVLENPDGNQTENVWRHQKFTHWIKSI